MQFIKLIKSKLKNKKNCLIVKNLGIKNYYSVLNFSDLMIGNSSSGIIESASFKIPTINFGDRQEGRSKTSSVVDCKAIKKEILKSIKKIYSKKFRKKLINTKNPYESKNSSDKIFKIIKKTVLPSNLKKKFYDL